MTTKLIKTPAGACSLVVESAQVLGDSFVISIPISTGMYDAAIEAADKSIDVIAVTRRTAENGVNILEINDITL